MSSVIMLHCRRQSWLYSTAAEVLITTFPFLRAVFKAATSLIIDPVNVCRVKSLVESQRPYPVSVVVSGTVTHHACTTQWSSK